MMKRLSQFSDREQLLAAAVAFIILGYLFYVGLCQPQILRLNSSSARLDGQKSQLRMKQQAIAAQRVSKQQKDELTQEIGKLDSCFFFRIEADRFLAGLSELAASSGCRVIQAAFVSEDKMPPLTMGSEENPVTLPGPDLSSISVRMNLAGRFTGFLAFLKQIEAHGRKVHVGQMNIEVVTHQRAELNVNFVLTVFIRDEGSLSLTAGGGQQ